MTMTTGELTPRASRVLRLVFIGAVAIAFAVGPTALRSPTVTLQATGEPCVNGVVPWNPYVVNCNLPARTTPKVRGAAPDAGAIIACHDKPGCLSWYVNN
ncbi:hypothetical protein [Mycolicibacterium sp. lyk4-40-TYG-92]|uniref:hypothetical protein n=1 Tax=Mycolicibacterium sp. lyk4-40-TYG-92 TaxID=3040295 RepID=UPI002549F082|nr:hypothetical protein [Mycolicibacterium sp. lyk4-40-TYG-92]